MNYYDKIDGLRFVAIFLVIIEHFAGFLGKFISAGYYGVDLFFVISGFLITTILLKPNEKSFKTNYLNFIGRRTLRIFPLYYLTVLLLWIVNIDTVREQLVWVLTYTFNYAIKINSVNDNSPIIHFWSLSVEEQFYIFWPILIISLKKYPRVLISLTLAFIIVGYSQMVFNIFPELSKFNYVSLLTRSASLCMGALGAIISLNPELISLDFLKKKWLEYVLVFITIFSLIIKTRYQPLILGFSSLYFVLKAAHFDFAINIINQFLKNKHIVKIGTVAYGIYIFHLPLAYLLTKYVFNVFWLKIDFASWGEYSYLHYHSWIIKFPIYSVLTYLLALFSFKYIESPILKLKDKFFKY